MTWWDELGAGRRATPTSAPPPAVPRAPSPGAPLRVTVGSERRGDRVHLNVEAPTLCALFEATGRAFARALVGELAPASGETVQLVLCARDREALLRALLGELSARAEAEGRVFSGIAIARCDGTRLEATLRAAPGAPTWRRVAAPCRDGVRIASVPGGVRASIALDARGSQWAGSASSTTSGA